VAKASPAPVTGPPTTPLPGAKPTVFISHSGMQGPVKKVLKRLKAELEAADCVARYDSKSPPERSSTGPSSAGSRSATPR
jgi:hypothetical protein